MLKLEEFFQVSFLFLWPNDLTITSHLISPGLKCLISKVRLIFSSVCNILVSYIFKHNGNYLVIS